MRPPAGNRYVLCVHYSITKYLHYLQRKKQPRNKQRKRNRYFPTSCSFFQRLVKATTDRLVPHQIRIEITNAIFILPINRRSSIEMLARTPHILQKLYLALFLKLNGAAFVHSSKLRKQKIYLEIKWLTHMVHISTMLPFKEINAFNYFNWKNKYHFPFFCRLYFLKTNLYPSSRLTFLYTQINTEKKIIDLFIAAFRSSVRRYLSQEKWKPYFSSCTFVCASK